MATTDILQAIRINDAASFESLLYLNYNNLNQYKQNALHTAIAYKRDDFSHELMRLNINLNQQDYNGQTPLHFAADHNNFKIVKSLIEKGAEISIEDKYGNQPLWTATFNAKESYDIVDLLVNAGADPLHKNKVGKCPRDIALRKNNPVLLSILSKE